MDEEKFLKKLIKLQKLVDIWKIIKRNKILSLNKKYDLCQLRPFLAGQQFY